MMAATIQTPAQQPTNNTTSSSPANPQLKRIVYSKYRELLGSYNDKANAIIESLPAYMVKEDRGFHFDPKIIGEVDKVVYGTPPAPPPLSTGSLPSQRLASQVPQYEAPACVQNAMMTKDKKPFTYTPGGIDLSQIKSQRMAKRLARNAQCEGASGQQQMNRPTQQSNGGTSPAAQLGATAMGMPFQVLPTGPPPPPPPQPNKAGPPPPPPAPQSKLSPQPNGNAAKSRKSPTPQNFEPPPMGFRPEIKIPPNPMAALKKVPPPQEKNNFWVEEYRKERSKSPMVGNDENDSNRSPPKDQQPETNQYIQNSYNNQYQPQQNQYRSPSPQPMRQASPHFSPQQSPSTQRQYQPPQFQYTPSTPQPQSPSVQRLPQQFTPPQQYQGPTSPQYQPQQLPMQQQQQQQLQQQQQQLLQQQQQQLLQQQQHQQLLHQQQQQQQQQQLLQQQQQQQLQQQQQQSVPWRSPRPSPHSIQNNVSRPREMASPAPAESPKPQSQPQPQMQQPSQTSPAYLRSREMFTSPQKPQSPPVSQAFPQRDRRIEGAVQDSQQPARQPAANRWVSQQQPPQPAEVQPLNRIKSPPPPSSNGFSGNSTGLRLQINTNPNSNTKERIIPIQLEQTPTPTRTPSAPGFGPQPFYTGNQPQYSSVPSPPLAQGATSNGQNSPSYVVRSPNQFVDQGYNNYPGSEDPNRVTSPTMQTQSPRIVQQTNTAGGVKTRVIPIALESLPDGPLNPNNVRGPISQQPLVIQNGNYRLFIHDCPLEAELQYRKHRLSDPRNQNTWGNGSTTPNQSKSFRILQKITDTTDDGGAEPKPVEAIDVGDPEPQLQRPTFARPMGPGQMNSPTIEQMKRMQLSNDQQAYANRARNPDTEQIPAAKGAEEDPRYRGPSNPSVTFKKLQGAVERCSPSRNADKDGTPPVMKQPQPTRYVNQRPVYSPEEQSQQYVHPSEQQVPEPKKYTGSAIPSRSFKILQAMTTPENAAEMEGSDVVESNQSITEYPFQQLPYPYAYPYPYMPSCCPPHPPPPSSSGGDVYNWPNPSPHHHPYHPHHHHPYPPYPYYYYYPPNEYDSQNFSQLQARDAFFRAHSQSQDLPDIIITPSGDDKPQAGGESVMDRGEREGSVIDTLTRKLSEIVKPVESELNMSLKDEKKYGGKEFVNSTSSVKSECENNKLSAEDSSDELLTSSTDPTTTSSSEECAKVANDGLHAIKSVTNIQVYNQKHLSPMDAYDDDLTAADGESMIFDEEEEEEEIVGEELEYDDEEVLIEEMDSDEEEEDMEDLYEDDEVIVMDDLSVIYEENETDILSPRPTSRISSSVSDATTIANEECEEEEEAEPIKENDDEENSNSVTVRLPLRFSFSRSSNDENIATVEVGNSQIEDKRRSFSIASLEADPEEDYESDCDVSVTISLSPSSGSFDRKPSLSPVPPKLEAVVAEEVDECDSDADDVSVSFSLPMRNKFMDQTLNGDLVNDLALKKNKKKNDDAAVEVWMENSRAFEDEEKNECQLAVEIKNTNGWCQLDDERAPGDSEKDNEPLSLDKLEEEDPDEEVDFWATLQATRKEAQLFLEKTANYWGKKIEERGKNEVVPVAQEPPTETQTDDDFWANIRVKDPIEKAKEPSPEENIEKVEEQKKTKTKAEKPKKKKKIVKAAEKEPETTGHVWSTIKVPNANNRAKIVESTIKMIQTKSTSKNPKETAKPDVKEIEVGDFVASIKTAYDKEDHSKVQVPSEEQAATAKPAAEKKKKKMNVEVVVPEVKVEPTAPTPSVTPEEKRKEEVLSKLIREKAELKTLILNQKFAKAFILPEKPVVMRGVLSEIEPEADVSSNMVVENSKIGQKWEFSAKISSPIHYEEQAPKKLIQEVEIVIEESEKVEKPKKKVIKSKKAAEESDGDTLKLPKPKTVKKSTKEAKKIKKKKSEDVEQVETAKVKEAVQEVTPAENKETEEVDFWSEIQSSKASRDSQEVLKIKTNKIDEENKVATSETVETASSEQEDIDFWAVIGSSKGRDEDVDFRATIETSRDSKAMIHRTESGTATENATFVVEQEEMVEVQTEEIDFWAEIQSSRKDTGHKDSVAVETKVETEVETKVTTSRAEMKKTQPDDVDFWSEIQSQREKVETSPIFETPGTEEIDFWAEISNNKANQSTECTSYVVETEPSPEEELPVIPKPAKMENQAVKPKTKKKVKKTTEGEESESSTKPKTKKKISKLSEESVEADAVKVKTKKKTSTTVEETSTEPETHKPKAIKSSTISTAEFTETASWTEVEVPKKAQKWSLPRADSAETDFWAEIEAPKPKATKKPNKVSHLHVYRDRDVELINVRPVPTYYAVYTEPKIAMDFWATISYMEEEPSYKASEEREADFWASNSSGNETEVNSEVDTGKIDFWVTQRKFEASGAADRDATPKREEPSEEIDFWAEIKDPKKDDPLPEIVKDECEVRRSNYKKAMAFFTSTVNVEKKDESPAPVKKLPKPSDVSVPREPSVAPVPREPSVVPVPRETSVVAVPREPSVVPVPRESSVLSVPPEPNSWAWRESVEQDWEAPEEREVDDVLFIVEDHDGDDDAATLIENPPFELGEASYDYEIIDDGQQLYEEQALVEEEESSESISDSTPNHFQIEHQYPKPEPEPIKPKDISVEPTPAKFTEEIKISVKDRIFAFETGVTEPPPQTKPKSSLIVDSGTPKSNLSRNSSQRSESEIEEDDSGVMDMNKILSETDTESESFPELRKMTRYQRASTHSRLFKLLQDEGDVIEEEQTAEEKALEAEFNFKPRKKIVHNVSITRKQNPKALQEAESMTQRRERLSLPLHKNSSIDADNLSSPNSPASPIFGQPSQPVSDKLVNELVQSLLLKKSSTKLKNLPMEKLQAAAKRVLEEELDSLENTSLDSTPALTPQEFKSESYSDYYDTWSAKNESDASANGSFDIIPSKAFRALQETTATAKRRPWAVRCPRVLSSKTVNRDLARVTESPEIFSRSSNSPEISLASERSCSIGRWRKV